MTIKMLKIYRATIDRITYEGPTDEYEGHFTSREVADAALEEAKRMFKVDWEPDPCGECADDGDDLLEAYVSEINVYETLDQKREDRAKILRLN